MDKKIKYDIMRYSLFSIVVIIFSTVSISYSTYTAKSSQSRAEFFKPVIEKLFKAGADTAFVKSLVANNKTKFEERFVRVNVIGYLTKTDYSHNYNAQSIRATRRFLQENASVLKVAEQEFNVSKEVIAAILWVETRHGNYLGSSHVPSVYLSTAMSDEPQFINMNKSALRKNFSGNVSELEELDKKIDERAKRKANWAVEQLLALEKMQQKHLIDIHSLYGSWAGAFGISQFIPSSFISWAVDGNNDGKINLFETEDAIFSVANYLKTNGWCELEECQRKAVFHYNNSSAYVDAVLTLTRKVTPQRVPKPLNEMLNGNVID